MRGMQFMPLHSKHYSLNTSVATSHRQCNLRSVKWLPCCVHNGMQGGSAGNASSSLQPYCLLYILGGEMYSGMTMYCRATSCAFYQGTANVLCSGGVACSCGSSGAVPTDRQGYPMQPGALSQCPPDVQTLISSEYSSHMQQLLCLFPSIKYSVLLLPCDLVTCLSIQGHCRRAVVLPVNHHIA